MIYSYGVCYLNNPKIHPCIVRPGKATSEDKGLFRVKVPRLFLHYFDEIPSNLEND